MGAALLVDVVDQIARGCAVRIAQDESLVTYAPMLSRELSPLNWNRTAKQLHDQVRGLNPWPAATTDIIGGQQIKVLAVEETGIFTSAKPGTIVAADKTGIRVACGDGTLLAITHLQAQGGRKMSVADYLCGHAVVIG